MYYLNLQIEKQSRYMIIFHISSDQNLRVIRKGIFYTPDAIHSVAISFITVAMVKPAAFHRRVVAESTD